MTTSKFNNIEKITSKEPIDFDITHDESTSVVNEEQSNFRLKEKIKAKDNHSKSRFIKEPKASGLLSQ